MKNVCDWHWRSAFDLRQALRSGQLSSTQTACMFAERIDALDGELHSFLSLDAEGAMRVCRALDAVGLADAGGVLAGLPYGLKDNFDVAGLATTCHSRGRAQAIASHNSDVKDRLDAAGAIMLGKNTMHELATGLPSPDLAWPSARNPWDSSLHPGGSSSGAGTAVAAGLVSFAVGSDTGGSVRNPASACGVYGFKPSFGDISTRGMVPLASSLDHVGLLTRSARDVALIMSVLSSCAARAIQYRQLAERAHLRPVGDHVIGLITAFSTDLDADGMIAADFDAVLQTLSRAGCRIRPLKVAALAEFSECLKVLVAADAYATHGAAIEACPEQFGASARARILAGNSVSLQAYGAARRQRERLSAQMARALGEVDIALSLSSLEFPAPIGDPLAVARTYGRHARGPFNLTGQPAASLPRGVARNGLPLALHVSAAAGRDVDLAAFMMGMEQAGCCGFVAPPIAEPPWRCFSASPRSHPDAARSGVFGRSDG